jgi:hypothetical protein
MAIAAETEAAGQGGGEETTIGDDTATGGCLPAAARVGYHIDRPALGYYYIV